MTSIPDDHEDTRRSSEDSARRLAAAVSGAIEGFLEALDDHDLKNEAQEAFHEAGHVARTATEEAKAQAATPEMRELGHDLKRAGTWTSDKVSAGAHAVGSGFHTATGGVKDGVHTATGSVKDGMHTATSAVGDKVHHAADSVREKAESVQYAARRMKEETKARAHAVAETSRRATRAPGRIRAELKAGIRAWWKGLVTAIALTAVMAVIGIVAFIVLTIALVVGLNELVGDPAGTFIVALLYVVLAGIALLVARSARTRAGEETARRIENSREEVRHVAAPVRNAFGRGRRNY